jgi:hypothetical protein
MKHAQVHDSMLSVTSQHNIVLIWHCSYHNSALIFHLRLIALSMNDYY